MYVALTLKYNFSIKEISKNRNQFKNKLCFKNKKSFLALKHDSTRLIINNQMKNGKFLKISNIFKQYSRSFLKSIQKLSHNNEIKKLYSIKHAFKDFDRILVFKCVKLNIIFNLKQRGSDNIIFYIKQNKRNLVILSWLKSLINIKKNKSTKLNSNVFLPITEFLISEENENLIHNLKIKIYGQKVLTN